MTRVLVAEKIGASGIDLLRSHFDVDLAFDIDGFDFADRIGEYDGLLIRSATKMTADLIDKSTNLKAIGRAGVGVDNVDVPAATKRGIIVANAPESNVVTAAEHTMALLLALARNVPQAHAALSGQGKWERSKWSGVELDGKVLGILGFGRIGQLVAARAKGFGLRVVAYDPFVSAERYKDLGVEKAENSDGVYAVADFLTLHLPKTPETEGWLDAEAIGKCKDGVKVLNVARGPLINDEDLIAALDSGKVGGAALDVFRSEPVTESLTGGAVTTAVNVPAIKAEDLEVLGPYAPLCRHLGRLAVTLAEASSIDRIEVELLGRIADRDTRPLATATLLGVLQGHTEEDVNAVNAPAVAEERGIEVVETKNASARDFENLVRVTVTAGDQKTRVVGTTFGRKNRPHLLEAWGQRFDVQLDEHLAVFRYDDRPGMIGRIGAAFGDAGVNIVSAAVGRQDEDAAGATPGEAVMVVTTDGAVPRAVVEGVVASDGFVAGQAITL
jgi:D-3-phosphoglycerate dehydrogenase